MRQHTLTALKGVTVIACAGFCTNVSAIPSIATPAPATEGSTAAPPPSPLFDPGQKIKLKSPLTGLRGISADDQAKNPQGSCLPYKSVVTVIQDAPVGSENTVEFSVDGKPVDTDMYCQSIGMPLVQPSVVYATREQSFQSANYTTQEWISGVLLVPFKFHLNDHSVTAASTIGGYFGYRFGGLGVSWTPILSGGLAILDSSPAQVPSTGSSGQSTSSSSSQTLTGFTAAVGLVGTISSSKTQIGVLIGTDWAGSSSQYKYEGKPWLSFEVGYSFLGAAK